MHLDDALRILGEFGTYQKSRLLLLCGFAVLCAWHALNMVFVGAEPSFSCSLSDVNIAVYNLSQPEVKALLIPPGESCRRYQPNSTLALRFVANGNVSESQGGNDVTRNLTMEECPVGFVYSKDQYESTITSQFHLVCAQKFWRGTSKSVFFAGRLVGALVFGHLSDRFGRRPMFFAGVTILVVAGSVAAAAPSMAVFLPMYFLQGAAFTGAFLVSFTLSTELVGPRYRVVAGIVIQMFFSIGLMTLAGIAYFIRNWRYLEIAITVPAVLLAGYWWLLPESIRWLLSHNKIDEAKRVLLTAARVNNVNLPNDVIKDLEDNTGVKDTRHYTYLDCVRTWRMARLSLNVWFNWLVNALIYYGLSLNTENLAGSPYLNFCLAGAVEIPAYVLCILVLNKIGRRLPLIVSMYLGGIACILSGVIPKTSSSLQVLTVALAMLGKFGITASYGIIYLVTSEVFPTVIRNIGMGVSSMSARIGSILAPILLETVTISPILPMIIFGSLSLLGATLAFLLPETAGRPLPQLIEDTDYGQNCLRLCKKTSDRCDITSGKKGNNTIQAT